MACTYSRVEKWLVGPLLGTADLAALSFDESLRRACRVSFYDAETVETTEKCEKCEENDQDDGTDNGGCFALGFSSADAVERAFVRAVRIIGGVARAIASSFHKGV